MFYWTNVRENYMSLSKFVVKKLDWLLATRFTFYWERWRWLSAQLNKIHLRRLPSNMKRPFVVNKNVLTLARANLGQHPPTRDCETYTHIINIMKHLTRAQFGVWAKVVRENSAVTQVYEWRRRRRNKESCCILRLFQNYLSAFLIFYISLSRIPRVPNARFNFAWFSRGTRQSA